MNYGVVELVDGITLVEDEARKNTPDGGGDDRTISGDKAGDEADANAGTRLQQKGRRPPVIDDDGQHGSPDYPQTASPGQHGNGT